jgi:hypothetical protein
MTDIRVPRPTFVLGDRVTLDDSFVAVYMRPLYGREDENGKRQIVGYVHQYAPEFDAIMAALNSVDDAEPATIKHAIRVEARTAARNADKNADGFPQIDDQIRNKIADTVVATVIKMLTEG